MNPPTQPVTTTQAIAPISAAAIAGIDASTTAGQIAMQLITIATTALTYYIFQHGTKLGIDLPTAGLIATPVVGYAVSFIWGYYQRIKLLNKPAPTQAVITAVAPTLEQAAEAALAANVAKATAVQAPPAASRILPLILFAGLIAGTVAGCASTEPTQRLYAAQESLDAAQRSASAAFTTGAITDGKAIQAIRLGLNAGYGIEAKAKATTQPTAQAFWLDQFEASAPTVVKQITASIAEKAGK